MTPEMPRSVDPFGFTETEKLHDWISHKRFQKIIEDEQTTIHKIELSGNSYGEFLFVTLSRQANAVTFWGMGYHEYRERWLMQEWRWYDTSLSATTDREKSIPKDEVLNILSERQQQIEPEVGRDTQSSRGKFFEFLADLTDEDGALSELEDIGDVPDWFDDGE